MPWFSTVCFGKRPNPRTVEIDVDFCFSLCGRGVVLFLRGSVCSLSRFRLVVNFSLGFSNFPVMNNRFRPSFCDDPYTHQERVLDIGRSASTQFSMLCNGTTTKSVCYYRIDTVCFCFCFSFCYGTIIVEKNRKNEEMESRAAGGEKCGAGLIIPS